MSDTKAIVREYFSVNEVMQITGLGRSTIYKALKSGALNSTSIGGRRLISRAHLDAFMSANDTESGRNR